MKVSFGQYKQYYEINPTIKQRQILYGIGERLNPTYIKTTKRNYETANLAKLLEDKKSADIEVVLSEDGTIDLSVVRNSGYRDVDGKKLKFVPYVVNGIGKLMMSINPATKTSTVAHKLDDFADKCYWYAMTSQSRQNSLLEDKLIRQSQSVTENMMGID